MSGKDELLWGVNAIAEEINCEPRRVYHLLNIGELPIVKKMGGRWVVSKRALWSFFDGGADRAV